MQMKTHKTLDFKVKQLGQNERRLRFIGSSEAEDRDGDIILASGWELGNYKKNPVFLWAHDYSIPPIGRALNVEVVNNELHFDIEFPEKGIHALADTVFELYKKGFMNATSVGFIGKDGSPSSNGTIFTKQELLELSAVPVPSNPTALQRAKSLGYISNGVDKFFDTDYVIEITDDEYIEIDAKPEEVKAIITNSVKKAIKG